LIITRQGASHDPPSIVRRPRIRGHRRRTFTHAQGRRFITEKDLFKFTWIADPQISPDGSTVVFVRVTVNEKENRYETSADGEER
jgi:hypothetical protein